MAENSGMNTFHLINSGYHTELINPNVRCAQCFHSIKVQFKTNQNLGKATVDFVISNLKKPLKVPHFLSVTKTEIRESKKTAWKNRKFKFKNTLIGYARSYYLMIISKDFYAKSYKFSCVMHWS